MIDLKKEIEKYRPIQEADSIKSDIDSGEVEDILDLIEMLNNN